MATDFNNIDQQALDLTHSIALTESAGSNGKPNYNANGDAGTSKGAYQWQPGNFEAAAKNAGLDPNDFSPTNQDKVAYSQVKAYKDKGYDPGQIASLWNSGSPDNWQNHSGTTTINGQKIKYDTPAYVQKVKQNYQTLSGGNLGQNSSQSQDYNPKPYSNTSTPGQFDLTGQNQTNGPSTPDNSLGGELAGRLNDASGSLTNIVGGEKTGQSRVSGVLQLGGAIGGAIGDTVNKGLELIPGVKALEGVIGNKVGQLAQTPGGQAIVKSLKDFSNTHPEISKDIGAIFNIVTALPILKGLGTIKNVVLDGVSQLVKKQAENVATKDFTAIVAKTVGGRIALENGGTDSIKTLIQERAIPDIEQGKYVTKEAYDKLGQNISQIEDNELQPTLKSVSTSGVDTKQPIEQLRQEALADIKSQFKATGQVSKAESEVNRVFDDYKNSYGDYISLEDVNDMKRGIRKSVNFNSPKLESDVTYHIGQVLQKNIEDSASKLGLPDIGEINQKMANLIKAQNILKYIEGKPVKTGVVGGLIKDAATAGGEIAGNATGVPFAGAYIGREVGGGVGKKLSSVARGILSRTGKGAVRTSGSELIGKTGGLLKGALAQKIVR